MLNRTNEYEVCINKGLKGVKAGAPHRVSEPYPDEFKKARGEIRAKFAPPFWVNEPWFFEGWTIETISRADATNVMYFASFQNMKCGRISSMKPGKFLKKFYGHILTDADIQALVARYNSELVGEVLFAETEDEICRVYQDGPRSCMSGHYDFEINPLRCYASPDLCVAYLKNADGKPTHRAVVWREKKEFIKTYGGDSRLNVWFSSNGWTQTSLDGARLRLVPHPKHKDRYIFPYSDSICSKVLSKCGKFAVFKLSPKKGDYCWCCEWDNTGIFKKL